MEASSGEADQVYRVEDSEVVYDGVLSTVRVDRVRMPDGSVAEREVVAHLDAVAVVAIDADGSVVLVRQHRHALGRRMLELPAGMLDVDGEDDRTAAQRELAEEVGLQARSWRRLIRFHNSAGWTDETTTVYLAEGLEPVAAPEDFTPEAEEADMEVVRLPLGEAVSAARRGEISDAKTLVGLLLAASTLPSS